MGFSLLLFMLSKKKKYCRKAYKLLLGLVFPKRLYSMIIKSIHTGASLAGFKKLDLPLTV